MKLAVGERNVATNLGTIFRLCLRILFYYLNYQPNERFQELCPVVYIKANYLVL